MPIVDGQVHMVPLGTGQWEDKPERGLDLEERRRRIADQHRRPDMNDLLVQMDRAGVDAVVLVPPMHPGNGPTYEHCIEAARAYPTRFAVMAPFIPERVDDLPLLDQCEVAPEILGMRVSFRSGRNNLSTMEDGSAEWLWRELETRGMPLMVQAAGFPEFVSSLASSHPTLRIIYDHFGISADVLLEDPIDEVRKLLPLARHANVALKASALPAVVTERFPFPKLQVSLRMAIETFGASRVFWGSDLSRLPCPYEQLVRLFSEELDFLTDDERSEVLGAGIVRWLGWRNLAED